jgi:cell division protein FtsA
VGLDSRALNGGIILTGGGSQLKHLIQLTEYTTGLNARIGLPNEHLAPNHIDELKKPMYSTCIGLILKGYSDYDFKYKEFTEKFRKVEVPKTLMVPQAEIPVEAPGIKGVVDVSVRKGKFWDKFKNNLIDMFKEEEDQVIK